MDLQKVTDNRLKIMKKMIAKNDQAKNPFYLAAYFQIPFKKACEEVEKIIPGNNQFPVFDLDDLVKATNARNRRMRELSLNMEADHVMEKFGMWHWPFCDVIDTSNIPSMTLSDPKYPLKYAISDYKINPTQENMEKIMTCARSRTDRVDTFLYLMQNGIKSADLQIPINFDAICRNVATTLDMSKNLYVKQEVRQALIDLKDEYKPRQIEQHTGVSYSVIRETDTIKKESILSESQLKKKQLIEKVWNLYTNGGKDHSEGLKQEEIGQMLGITRHTVSSYLRQYKLLHPDEIDHTQLTRPRHTGMASKQYKEENYKTFAKTYQSFIKKGRGYISALELTAKKHDTTVYHVRRAAIQEGYYIPQKSLSQMRFDQAAGFAKEGYDASQVSLPATTMIMNKQKIVTPEEKTDRQAVGIFIARTQRDSMDMIRSTQNQKKAFLKEGSLRDAMPAENIRFGQDSPDMEEEFQIE